MHRARVLALASAALVFVSSVAHADLASKTPAGTKTARPKPKKKKPKAEDSAAATGDTPATPDPPAPEPPKPADTKTTPVTQAADTKPAEAKPEPNTEADVGWGEKKKRRDDVDDGGRFSVAPLLGYSSTAFGFGIGARAGYTFENKVYLGGTFMFHFGYSYAYGLGLYGGGSVGGASIFYPAVEVGYDFKAGPVTIRPMMGGGPVFSSVSSTTILGKSYGGGTHATGGIYPGVMAAWNIPKSDFFVGGDTRIVIPFEGYGVAWGFYATAGMKF